MTETPRLAVTAGEPAGIGPDLLIQLAQQPRDIELIVIADPDLIQQRATLLNLPIELVNFNPNQPAEPDRLGVLKIMPVNCPESVVPGELNTRNSRYVLETLQLAVKGCQDGQFNAMVTAPLHKGIINDAGIPFTGHTEFLAELTAAPLPVMMLTAILETTHPNQPADRKIAVDLRVALATTHLPLRQVSDAITRESLRQVISVLHHDLRHKFGIPKPDILVCGLNPHAGENGHLGTEEIDIIYPVINELRQQGMQLSDPLPADTLFTPKYLVNADAVLAMYHDQGLPVLKHVGFGNAVNITLGLPIIRTSVDHGTALDLAGTGKANTGSLEAAIEAAKNMVLSQQPD